MRANIASPALLDRTRSTNSDASSLTRTLQASSQCLQGETHSPPSGELADAGENS